MTKARASDVPGEITGTSGAPSADRVQKSGTDDGHLRREGRGTDQRAETLRLSAETFKYWHADYEKRESKVVFQDGRILEEPFCFEEQLENLPVRTSTFDWEMWGVFSQTTRGHVVMTEGYNPYSPPPLHGRSSVYLDQNHWKTVSDAFFNPSRVGNAEEGIAAEELADLVMTGRVVLPLSEGHLLETSSLHSDERYEVGVVQASLTRGWQLREPMMLWKAEAEATARRHLELSPPLERPAITTEPGALFGSEMRTRRIP